jgi:hypothetical protein
MKTSRSWTAPSRCELARAAARRIARLSAWAALALMPACGGSDPTAPSALATFAGNYTLTIGTDSYPATGSDFVNGKHREAIFHSVKSNPNSLDECGARLGFIYAQDGSPASEVSSVDVLGSGGTACPLQGAFLRGQAGSPAPTVVVRNGRNEVDDGVLSGTTWKNGSVSGIHWSVRAR